MDSNVRDSVIVVGQIARDLVLRVAEAPPASGSSVVQERLEQLGGKGANLGVGLRQLGANVVLIGIIGEDDIGQRMLDEALKDGLDLRFVPRRGRTALFVDIVDQHGQSRLLEDVPEESLVSETDVRAAAAAFERADTVCLQLQQPAEALAAAAELAAKNNALVALDGSVEGAARDILLKKADVVRADDREAEILTGVSIRNARDAARAAKIVFQQGPTVVAFAVPGEGDLVAWPDGSEFFPHGGDDPVDVIGAGDAFFAGLVTALRRGDSPAAAGRMAAAAAASTVAHLGGRPNLTGLYDGDGWG